MNIPDILFLIRPRTQWVLRGDSYEGLEWLDSTPKPTLEELQDGQLQLATLAYREKRAAEYPPIGDQLDALWKGGDDYYQMRTRVNEVKNKFPKPL